MKLINGTFFIVNSVSEEEAQTFLDEQERFLERPVIVERVNEKNGTRYVTGRILDDIFGNLEVWSKFERFEGALEETEKFKDAPKEKQRAFRQV